MDKLVQIAIITGVVVLTVVYMLKDVMVNAGCTEITFFESKISICDDATAENLKKETKQLTNLIKELEADYEELSSLNEIIKTELKDCNESIETKAILKADSSINNKFLRLKPSISIYKELPDFRSLQPNLN